MAKIRLEQLSHSYYPNPKSDADFALKTIDYLWDDGGAYALLGPSGCGKTTLLNIISGLLLPSRGNILFDDLDVTRQSPEQRNIAQVFQFPVIYDTMTVAQNLAFPLANRRVDPVEIKSRVSDMLDILDLKALAGKRAQGLTADEKQKISLGRGLVRYDVNAILFDEPLTVIDPQMKWQLRTKLKEMHQRFGHTMIYVTHDQTEALTFADKVVVMYEGEVVQIGTPEELFERPGHTFVGYFIGSPGMNILPCRYTGNSASVDDQIIPLSTSYDIPSGVKLELGIRPEFISFTDKPDQGLAVQLRGVDDIGRHKIASVALGDHLINVMVAEGGHIPELQPRILFDPLRCSLYADSHRVVPAQGEPDNSGVAA